MVRLALWSQGLWRLRKLPAVTALEINPESSRRLTWRQFKKKATKNGLRRGLITQTGILWERKELEVIRKTEVINRATNFCSLPRSSAGKESSCIAGDPDSTPGLGRSTGEGIGYSLQYSWASLLVQLKNLPAMQETQNWSQAWEDPLEKGTAIQLQYSGLENSMDCTVLKSWTPLSDFHFLFSPTSVFFF